MVPGSLRDNSPLNDDDDEFLDELEEEPEGDDDEFEGDDDESYLNE